MARERNTPPVIRTASLYLLIPAREKEYDPRMARSLALANRALQALLVVLGLSTRASLNKDQCRNSPGLDSDDAERQADALSSALRSRARLQPGWTVSDNTDSIALITAAPLRCPSHPDATCEKHIGEQLKTDKFFWGNVHKVGPGQLSAEVHYWQRGKAGLVGEKRNSSRIDQRRNGLERATRRLAYLRKIDGIDAIERHRHDQSW